MDISLNTGSQELYKASIQEKAHLFQLLTREIHKVIMGQEEAVQLMIMSLLCKSHFLLEGLPGVAKTTMIKTLAQTLGLNFKRIQFTPDLLPSDIIGTLIFNPKTHEFETKRGPIFAHVILADEINRAPAKVQSALLEAMQERQVTIGSNTFALEEPFLVCATQNPIEQEGTYRLPEAQVDRFMFKIPVNYPTMQEEKRIITLQNKVPVVETIVTHDDLQATYALLEQLYVDERIIDYIARIVQGTRTTKKYFVTGASPRATIALYQAARAHAFLRGRSFVTPDDVRSIAIPVLHHRVVMQYEFEGRGQKINGILDEFVSSIPVP